MLLAQLRRLAALKASEQWLLLHTAIVVASVRLALWVLPFQRVCARARGPHRVSPRLASFPASRLVWAVRIVARRIYRASCLTQALALQWLLLRAGQDATVHIGVSRSAGKGLESHAWLQSRGVTLLGDEEGLDRFAPLLALPEAKA